MLNHYGQLGKVREGQGESIMVLEGPCRSHRVHKLQLWYSVGRLVFHIGCELGDFWTFFIDFFYLENFAIIEG